MSAQHDFEPGFAVTLVTRSDDEKGPWVAFGVMVARRLWNGSLQCT